MKVLPRQSLNNALLLESLGVSALVLECIPSDLAKTVSEKLTIPTIGIGAGVDCDGQVLVSYRYVRNYYWQAAKVCKEFP